MSQDLLRIKYVKSAIGYSPDQRHTLHSLGLRRLNQVVEKPNTPAVRGMVYKIRHLVEVEGHGQLNGADIQGLSE